MTAEHAPFCVPGGQQTWTGPGGAPTVAPSILCPDCGTHGFITNGRWVDA